MTEQLTIQLSDSQIDITDFQITTDRITLFEQLEKQVIQLIRWVNIRQRSSLRQCMWYLQKVLDRLCFGGIAELTTDDEDIAKQFFFPVDALGAIVAPYEKDGRTGVLLKGVHQQGIAQRAGLQIGDIILEWNGVAITKEIRPYKNLDGSVTSYELKYLRNEQEYSVVVAGKAKDNKEQLFERIGQLFGLQKISAGKFTKPRPQISEKPFVSVLMHAYKPTWFAEALTSVLNQSYQHFEIIIGDDNPRGEIKEIVDRLAPNDPRIRYFRHDPPLAGWGSGNRYFCFEKAQGDLIKYLCDDDILYPQCIEKMVNVLQQYPEVSLVTSHRTSIDEKGRLHANPSLSTRRIVHYDSVIEGTRAINVFVGLGFNMIGEPSTPMFRKKQAGQYFFYLDDFAGIEAEAGLDDIYLWMSLLCKGKLFYCSESLSGFRRTDEQATSDDDIAADVMEKWQRLIITLLRCTGGEVSDFILMPKREIPNITNKKIEELTGSELCFLLEQKEVLSKIELRQCQPMFRKFPYRPVLSLLLRKKMGVEALPLDGKNGNKMLNYLHRYHFFSETSPINLVYQDEAGYLFYVADMLLPFQLVLKIQSMEEKPFYCRYQYQGKIETVPLSNQIIVVQCEEIVSEHLFQFWAFDQHGVQLMISEISIGLIGSKNMVNF